MDEFDVGLGTAGEVPRHRDERPCWQTIERCVWLSAALTFLGYNSRVAAISGSVSIADETRVSPNLQLKAPLRMRTSGTSVIAARVALPPYGAT